jgi:hypothetical protein
MEVSALDMLNDPEVTAAIGATDPLQVAGVPKTDDIKQWVKWYYILMVVFVGIQLITFAFKAFRRNSSAS